MRVKWLLAAWTSVAWTALRIRTTSSEENSQHSLKLDRATAYTLMVEVPCHPYCETPVSLEYKTSSSAPWANPEKVSIHSSFNDTFILEDLQPDTLYFLRARLDAAGHYSGVMAARTCPVQPPPVSSLRVADAGAGWLDVRWTPPTERCDSRFWYAVRYKARGKEFTAIRKYGMYTHEVRYVRFRPTHPCPTWPAEFCLLLTDSVEPGKNHTVEVQVVRVVSMPTDEKSAPATAFGFANTSNVGRSNVSVCPHASADATRRGGGRCSSDEEAADAAQARASDAFQVPLWVTISGWATAAFLLVAISVMYTVVRTDKTHRNECNNPSPTSPEGSKGVAALEKISERSAVNFYSREGKDDSVA